MTFRAHHFSASALITALTVACTDAPAPTAVDAPRGLPPVAPDVALLAAGGPKTRSILPTGKQIGFLGDPATPSRPRYRIESHGGRITPVFNVYVVYYGTWSAADQTIIGDFLSHVGGSAYLGISRLYPGADGTAPSGQAFYGGAALDLYSHGTWITDADVEEILSAQFATGALPLDTSGLFIVLASEDVQESSGLGSAYCAYHGGMRHNGTPVLHAFVGNPARYPTRCAPQAVGPNGTLGGDAAVSLIAAELFNAMTDPHFDAWFDRLGLEAADKCAWTYGTTYKAANGALANVHLGSRDYLLQQLWVPSKSGGACGLAP